MNKNIDSKIEVESFKDFLNEADESKDTVKENPDNKDSKADNKEEKSSDKEDTPVKLTPEEENKVDKASKDAGLDEKKKGILATVYGIIKKALLKYSRDTTGKYLDILMLGNFKDAIARIYKEDKASSYKPDEIKSKIEELDKNPSIQKSKKYKALDNRKDDNTSTEMAPDSLKFSALWYGGNGADSLKAIVTDLDKQISEIAKQAEEASKKLRSDLDKMKISNDDVTDDDIKNFGPVLVQMVTDKKKPDEIKKKAAEMRKQVKESFDSKLNTIKANNMLFESKVLITEDLKTELMLESIVSNKDYQDVIDRMITEGILSKSAGFIWDKMKKAGSKVVDTSKNAIEFSVKHSIMPILKLAGTATQIVLFGWGPAIILKIMDTIEQHGKEIRNSFERWSDMFKNSKGTIARMDFAIKNDSKKKYSLRYYVIDQVWRGINVTDQLKMPTKDFVKTEIESDYGKKFRDSLKKSWDPIFGVKNGSGKVDYAALFKNSKGLDVPDDQIKMLEDFGAQYDKIVKNCIESPVIDTQMQSMKTAMGKKDDTIIK